MKRFEIDYNPVFKKYKELEKSLPIEVVRKLDLIDTMYYKKFQLNVIKKSKKSAQTGDIFVIEPVKGIYFYGKVLVGSVECIDEESSYNGFSVIVIFKTKTYELTLDNYNADYDNLLIEPTYVSDLYWKKGYFHTIANQELTEVEVNLDYGFFESFCLEEGGYFENAIGECLSKQPKLFTTKGIETDIGIAMGVWMKFIVDPSLLDNKYDFTENGIVEINSEQVVRDIQVPDNEYIYLDEDDVLIINLDNEYMLNLGNEINLMDEYAYMNGYNLEVLLGLYLQKVYPGLLENLETDPEAAVYVAYYSDDFTANKNIEKLFDVVKTFIENSNAVFEFLKQHEKELLWV